MEFACAGLRLLRALRGSGGGGQGSCGVPRGRAAGWRRLRWERSGQGEPARGAQKARSEPRFGGGGGGRADSFQWEPSVALRSWNAVPKDFPCPIFGGRDLGRVPKLSHS